MGAAGGPFRAAEYTAGDSERKQGADCAALSATDVTHQAIDNSPESGATRFTSTGACMRLDLCNFVLFFLCL